MTDHIQMPDVTPIIRYLADGAQDQYAYPFPIFASEDLAVYLAGARQSAGFTITGAGQTTGGNVIFDVPPAEGIVVTLARELPLERVTDYLEGGDFSAQSINNELDYLVAAVQQVNRANGSMLRYGDHEAPGLTGLPSRAQRAGKALGFDGDGNPVAVSLEGSMAAPDFTAQGTGAATRASTDKLSDVISVKDFGAVGDGLTDDTLAIQNALSQHYSVFVPPGTYLISNSLTLGARRTLWGTGQASVIKCQSNSFTAISLPGGYATLQNLRIEGGAVGVLLAGSVSECVQNLVSDVQIVTSATGLVLDGYTDTGKPCYWNTLRNILIERPTLHGVHMKKSGAGDTPNANHFHTVRVYSKGASTTGSGFYVEHGGNANSFIDCEANVNGLTAQACFRVGAQASKTLLINLYTESTNSVPNIRLDAGSSETSIMNLHAQSDGAAIYDFSGGSYDAYNSGYPAKNTLRRTVVSDLKATLLRFDTEFIDTPGSIEIDLSHSVHIVNASVGAIDIVLPGAADAAGAQITVKKSDVSANIVTISESGGNGPDGLSLQLGGQNDHATMISNGAAWFVVSSNRSTSNTRYFDGTGTYDIDMAVDTYLLSSFGGAMTARLPPANAAQALGRKITIKKVDASANAITVTEQGGAGPDQSSQPLSTQYKAITVLSNGSQWYVINKF